MESNWNSSLPWLQGNEQDFPLGAKATPFLLPATADVSAEFKHVTFELPEWMESRESLGLSGVDLFDDVNFETEEQDLSYEIFKGSYDDMEEDYNQTIKPEDMLVPLSDLQPEIYTPQGLGANTLLATTTPTSSVIPKISIRVNKIQVPVQKQEHQKTGIIFIPASPAAVMPTQNMAYQIVQPQNFNVMQENDQNLNAEELINELVDMATDEPNILTNLISSFDASIVQAGMDDLLSQLESCEDKAVLPNVSQWSSEPASPVCVPSPVPSVGNLSPRSTVDQSLHHLTPTYIIDDVSPVPSVGSLSPQSTVDQSFNHLTPVYTIDDASIQLDDKNTSFSSVMSPLSECSESISSPSFIDEESDMEYSKSEMHSYSRSPSKRKNTRKSGRGSSFPEGRKERKKEQNKQAALRYRQKKKQEDDVLMSQIEAEEKRQKELKAKYTNLKQELSCLKKIMREVLIAKGTLSPKAFEKKK